MSDEELAEAITKGESEVLEFKKSTAQIEKALKAVCAFLNHKGGTVYFGIDKGKAVGQEVSDSTLKSISQKIRQKIKPEVSPEIKILEIEGKKIIDVRVKKGNNKPYYLDGIAYKRVGSENVAVSPEELERIILEKMKGHWDSEICESATIGDIAEAKVRQFVRDARKQRGLALTGDGRLNEMLVRLRLTKDKKPTNACILLFGRDPQKFFPLAEIKCVRFKGKDVTGPMLDMKIVSGNIIDQIKEAEKFIFDHIRLESWIEEGKIERQEKWEYPLDAIREALVNALCHRDYSSQSNSQVRIFDDRMEFWNPGKLPAGWTVETLRKQHESKPMNPLIAKQFFWIKYVEDVGTGTNKIFQWCVENGLPEPLFEFTGTSIVVILRKSFAKEELSKLGLNERQIKATDYATKSGSITNKEYQNLNNTTKRTATRDLAGLVQKGIFNRVGRGKREIKYVLVLGQNIPNVSLKMSQNG